jgi:serralysin
MSNITQKGLEGILALLENNDQITPVRTRRFSGTARDDLFLGNEQNNVASGKGRKDVLMGGEGDDNLSGDGGNDLLFGGVGNDSLSGGAQRDTLSGDEGDDQLDGGNGNDFLDGGIGTDTLVGGNGLDQLVGGDGIDTLTGGVGADKFIYKGDLFVNGATAPAGQTGIQILNTPDIITDYTIGEDQFVLDRLDLGIDNIVFQKGQSGQIADGNVIVLTDGFAAAGAAARAIANNATVQSDEGVFVYFNTTLGLSRVVYSKDLSGGGDISVLANLDNQRGQSGLTNLANFTEADFALG